MEDKGNIKAITLQGIVRNETKIGVQDGQAEDLLNLRFVDGSWRTSGDGRYVYSMSENKDGYTYTQLFVHTNVYRHILGVRDGKLWWFASIDKDGVTFRPLKSDNSSSSDAFEASLPDAPVELTSVVGDLTITQTGHLLTVIDGEENFEYLVYKASDKSYKQLNADVNGGVKKAKIYPFGVAHFNLSAPFGNSVTKTSVSLKSSRYWNGYDSIDEDNIRADIKPDEVLLLAQSAREEIREKNMFSQPFLICAAVRLYDGSYAYASNPILLNPGSFLNYERLKNSARVIDSPYTHRDFSSASGIQGYGGTGTDGSFNASYNSANTGASAVEGKVMTVLNGGNSYREQTSSGTFYNGTDFTAKAYGYRLQMQLEDVAFILANPEIFQSVCIFVTRELETIDFAYTDFNDSHLIIKKSSHTDGEIPNATYESLFNVGVKLPLRSKLAITSQMEKENFFLLREYKIEELSAFANQTFVNIDLNTDVYPGLLKNLVQEDTLPIEALVRDSYLPKATYMYNGRLHIANYRVTPWRGYAISNYYNPYVGGSGYGMSNEPYVSILLNTSNYALRDIMWFMVYFQLPLAYVKITSRNTDGTTRVAVRSYMMEDYVKDDINTPRDQMVNTNDAIFGDFLNPLLCFGGISGVISVEIYVMQVAISQQSGSSTNFVRIYKKTFTANHQDFQGLFSAYINDDLLDNTLGSPVWSGTLQDCFPAGASAGTPDIEVWTQYYQNDIENNHFEILQEEAGMTDYFPNGLKVSKTDNPMFFPVENTYQVGSAEILALCSNAIAVGTGQTGAAPLYVFCADGIYALFVDASGEMAYTNARVIARDVLNNPRSVTPTDQGVAFTTDRGLMMIAGEQVQEIGQPAEGDVLKYFDEYSPDHIKIAKGALTKVAEFPLTICDKTDFLTYIKDGAIVNYNHNERELIVSNPTKETVNGVEQHKYPYSYVLDRNGNWSRRDYTADEYVNNYPTSYRLVDGQFYKVDEEGSGNTPLEQRKEADNKFFYLSNVIKLDSIGFKQAYRFVVRGYFETLNEQWRTLVTREISPTDFFQGYASRLLVSDELYEEIEANDVIRFSGSHSPQIVTVSEKNANPKAIFFSENLQAYSFPGSYTIYKQKREAAYIGCYVLGSYDGRKWAMLGGNEKKGKFTDIGCKIERTDVKFLRVCLAGQVTGKTRVDYMEMSSAPSMLNTKIR